MKLETLLTDEKQAAAGKWLKLDDAELLIASSNNHKYRAALRANSKGISKHKLKHDEKTQDTFYMGSLVDAIFLDFRGIEFNGKPLANTRENRLLILKAKPVLDFVEEQMDNLANFQAEEAEAEAQDLEPQQPGT